MAEKFTAKEVCQEDFVSFIMMRAISSMDSDKSSKFKIEEIAKDGEFEVELRIGGHEYSMRKFLKWLSDAYDYTVANKALEISRQKCGNIFDRIDDFDREVKRLIRDVFPDIEFRED